MTTTPEPEAKVLTLKAGEVEVEFNAYADGVELDIVPFWKADTLIRLTPEQALETAVFLLRAYGGTVQATVAPEGKSE